MTEKFTFAPGAAVTKKWGNNVQTYKLYKLLRDKELFSAYQFSKHVINVGFGKLALGWVTGVLAW